MMEGIKLIRIAEGEHTTLGHLYINGLFCCYTLENIVREHKIPGETAIPAGAYTLGLNTVADMNGTYGSKYKGRHEGMVEVRGIPGFSLVFFHVGNYHTNTRGCLLVGSYYRFVKGDYRVLDSALAYLRVYPMLVAEIKKGNRGVEVLTADHAATGNFVP